MAAVALYTPLGTTGQVPLPPEAFPTEDDVPTESRTARNAANLLWDTLSRNKPRLDLDIGLNQFLYYDQTNPRRNLSPDFWAAVGVTPKVRQKWEVWAEGGLVPDVAVEIVSPSSGQRDKVAKVSIYTMIGVNEYFWLDPEQDAWMGYRRQGQGLFPVPENADGSRTCQALGLELVWWEGEYADEYRRWWRWRDATGQLLLTGSEQARAEQEARRQVETALATERVRAEAERLRAEAAQDKADRLQELLRSLGHEVPNDD